MVIYHLKKPCFLVFNFLCKLSLFKIINYTKFIDKMAVDYFFVPLFCKEWLILYTLILNDFGSLKYQDKPSRPEMCGE